MLSDLGNDDDPDYMPAVQEDRLFLKLSFVCQVSFLGKFFLSMSTSFFLVKIVYLE